MRLTILLLALSLWATPLVGQHTPRRHSVLAGGGALTGAFVVSVVCDRPEGQREWGICGRSAAGSAFNGGILGGFTGHVTHLLTANPDYVASPGRLLFVRANDDPPCPPEPEPCPPPRKGRWIERNRSVVFAGAGAVAGAFVGVAVCGESAPGPEESDCLYPAISGAAVGALAGYLAYMFVDGQRVWEAAQPSVDLVTFRLPIG